MIWKTFEIPFLKKYITFSSKWCFLGRIPAFHGFLMFVRKLQSPNYFSSRTPFAFHIKIW